MPAPSTLLALLWCSPHLGAALVPEGEAVVHAGGGLHVVLPVLSAGATTGVAEDLDLEAAYEVHAGLAHTFSATLRHRLAEDWALGMGVSQGFIAIEEIGGILSVRAPFGTGLSVTPSAHRSLWTQGGLHVGLSAGLAVRLLAPEEAYAGGPVRLAPQPRLHSAWVEAGVEWPGGTFFRARLVVPIQAELRVLGYLPLLVFGHQWSFGP